MTMQFVAASTVVDAINTTPTVSVPAGVADGDMLILTLVSDIKPDTTATPAGWTLLQYYENTLDNQTEITWYKLAASEPASYTITIASVNSKLAMSAYRSDTNGAITVGTPVTASGLQTVSADIAVSAGDMLVGIWGNDSLATVSTAPAGMTQSVAPGTTGNTVNLTEYYESQSAAGTVTKSLTWSTDNGTVALFTLSDAAASDTTPPVLSNQSVTPGWKTADSQVDTDDTGSAVYCAIAPATAPAPADGNAIIDGTYTDAVATVSATPTGTTVTLPQVTGLPPNTQYVAYFASRDAVPNTSAVVSATFTTLSANATFAITGAVNETDWTVILFDGAVSGNPNKLKAVSATGPDASGNLVINLDDVNVTDGQVLEGIAVDASIDKPAPLRGNVSIA